MFYHLNKKLYKKLMSNNQKHFEALVEMGNNFPRRDQKVIATINQQFGLQQKVTGVSIRGVN